MTEPAEGDRRDLARIEAFSDGVFAIAITLLALDLRLPQDTTPATLNATLNAQQPHLWSFLLSFAIIGTYWAAHRRTFSHIVRVDSRLVLINLLVLLTVAFLPFSTSVMAEFGETTAGVTLYAWSIVATGLAMTLLWIYAFTRKRLVTASLPPDVIRLHLVRALAAPVVFAISIPVARRDPAAATTLWYVLGGSYFFFDAVLNGRKPARRRNG